MNSKVMSRKDLTMLLAGMGTYLVYHLFFAPPSAGQQSLVPYMMSLSVLLFILLNLLSAGFRKARIKPILCLFIIFLSYWISGFIFLTIQEGFSLAKLIAIIPGLILSIPLVLVSWQVWVFGIIPLFLGYYGYGWVSEKVRTHFRD